MGAIGRGDLNPQRVGRVPYHLTAKAWRALGVVLPESIPDDAVVELVREAS